MTSSAARISFKRITATAAILGLATIGLAATPKPANAWWYHHGYCCGVGIGVVIPPVVVAPPPAYYAPPQTYDAQPQAYYAPSAAYYAPPSRAWIPAHWQDGYWIPGHWS